MPRQCTRTHTDRTRRMKYMSLVMPLLLLSRVSPRETHTARINLCMYLPTEHIYADTAGLRKQRKIGVEVRSSAFSVSCEQVNVAGESLDRADVSCLFEKGKLLSYRTSGSPIRLDTDMLQQRQGVSVRTYSHVKRYPNFGINTAQKKKK